MNVGGTEYVFSGDHMERKIFETFTRVNVYKRTFNTLIDFFHSQIRDIRKSFNKQAVVVNHNFVDSCKQVRDPLTDIFPNFKGAKYHEEQVEALTKHLRNVESRALSSALLDVDRAITSLQTQISGLQILSGEYVKTESRHNLLSMVDSFLVPFERSLFEKNIRIVNTTDDASTEQELVDLDYNLLNWAFFHILNNAVKYCRPNSDLIIRNDFYRKTISVEMDSLRVEEDEVDAIFEQGKRGKNSEGTFSGEGLGMYFTKFGLDNLGAKITFTPINQICVEENGKQYCRNVIQIALK
jgi:K+-sensing histidine kinase KdpD